MINWHFKYCSVAAVLVFAGLALVGPGFAQEDAADDSDWPTEEELQRAEHQDLEIDNEPIELDEITVTGEQFTLEQEAGLRLIRQALDTHRSYKRKDRYEWVCRFRRPVGRHLKYLECARNGDFMAISFNPTYPTFEKDMPKDRRFGIIWTSNRPVNEKKFKETLSQLAGPADFDKEFVAMALQGQSPPRNIPTDEELDLFSKAYAAIEAMSELGSGEDEMISLIEDQGLTVSRYNEIVDLVETYQSIENAVAERLADSGFLGSESGARVE